jgi:hypothetical protein
VDFFGPALMVDGVKGVSKAFPGAQLRCERSVLEDCSRLDSSGFGNCLGVWDFWDWRRRWGAGVCGVFRLATGLGGRA